MLLITFIKFYNDKDNKEKKIMWERRIILDNKNISYNILYFHL